MNTYRVTVTHRDGFDATTVSAKNDRDALKAAKNEFESYGRWNPLHKPSAKIRIELITHVDSTSGV